MKKTFLLMIFMLIGTVGLIYGQVLQIVTEEYPPYNYTENGKVTGLSTEIVEAVLKETGLKGEIKVFPWARAYDMAQKDANTLIYSIGRIPDRENLFKWVGVIAPYDVYIFALKERKDIVINSLDDAKKYRLATTIDDAREKYLKKNGFVVGQNIDSGTGNDVNLKKLMAKRVDLWPIAELVAFQLVKNEGKNPDNILKKAFHIKDLSSDGLYMAFSKATPDETVKKFQVGLEKVKANGTFAKIMKKYNIKASS